jgi:hypothetical protein
MVNATIYERQMSMLMEESRDLHAGAMRDMPAVLKELTDLRLSSGQREGTPEEVAVLHDRRRSFIKQPGLGDLVTAGVMTGAFASTLTALLATPVRAKSNLDIQIMQTASSLEILAVGAYGVAPSVCRWPSRWRACNMGSRDGWKCSNARRRRTTVAAARPTAPIRDGADAGRGAGRARARRCRGAR